MSAPVLYLNAQMKQTLDQGFAAAFGGAPERYFSAPGRTEIGGNHTDHQRGRVLAGAVNLDTVAAVKCNGTNTIRIQSKGYPISVVDLSNLTPVESLPWSQPTSHTVSPLSTKEAAINKRLPKFVSFIN